MPLATLMLLTGTSFLIWINTYYYKSYIIDAFSAFPAPVAEKLRRALYYTNIDPQPKQALKYFKQALEKAREVGMDGFSGEVMGIKIEMARMFEKVGAIGAARDVLGRVREELVEWLEERGGDYGVGRRKIRVLEGEEQGGGGGEEKVVPPAQRKEVVRWETEAEWRKKRTVLLMMAVRASCHLGNLYADPKKGEDREKAEQLLVWGVTAQLKESKKRSEEGVEEGEEDWFPDDEIGAALECKLVGGRGLFFALFDPVVGGRGENRLMLMT